MANITIIRGDSYALRRPLYTYTIVDENSAPFNLAGCTIRTTYKVQSAPISIDPDDQLAAIRHIMTVDLNGVATLTTGLYLSGPASAGIVHDRMSATETKTFTADAAYISDLQLTDANGEVFTWLWNDGVIAVDGITNRDT